MSDRPENIEEEHWKPLGKISDIEMGQSPPSNYVFEGLDEGLPFLQGNAEFGVMSPHPKYSCALPAKIGKAGSLLISVRAPVGAVNIADQDYCIGRGLAAIFPKRYPASFLAAAVSKRSPELARVSQGTTFDAIGKRELHSVCVYAPDQSTASKIAEILDTLDAAIRETEAVVAKLKAMKRGVLHDLLTRGIDANGDLRPSQSEAPHLYKQTPLGWLPKEWEETDVFGISTNVTSGSRDWARYYSETGAIFVRIGNLTREHVNLRLASVAHVKPPSNTDGQRTSLEEGDVLVSITADLGIVGVIPEKFGEAYINQHVALIRPNKNLINPRFLGHFLASPILQNHLSKLNDAGAKAGLNLPTIRGLPVMSPNPNEQDRIAERLDEIDTQIGNTQVETGKLKSMKSGIMDDLLTGRTSVTPLL